MALQIYNTRTHQKETFQPLEENHVKMYVCGITAYDFCHIGHARSALVFDMVYNYLQYRGYKVTFVRNFTDIDDKIINRANEQGTTCEELSERFIKAFNEDMAVLGISKPTLEPKATEHVGEIIAMIQTLIDKDMAYQLGNDVYYAVNKFAPYGGLSGRNIEDLQAGARIDINEQKRTPMDFALWKGSKPGEPTWESPWGPGRPGWHIECSAMSRKYLGDTFDIHGGGEDLVFPHHENEVAQSEAATGKPFVTTWIHHAFVTIREEKMSKSLNNFLTIREVLKEHHPEALRLTVFTTHYRHPLDYSEDALKDAQAGLNRLYNCMAECSRLPEGSESGKAVASKKEIDKLTTIEKRFQQAMDNDFNTAQGVGILFEGVKCLNRIRQALPKNPAIADIQLLKNSKDIITRLGQIMGLLRLDPLEFIQEGKQKYLEHIGLSNEQIDQLIEQRFAARANKDWGKADEIRNKLLEQGIELKDGPDGTVWKIAGT